MSVIDLNAMQGIITMPSLHAALAFILACSVRGTILFVPIAALNALMAFSTLTVGGHYLIDTIAGIVGSSRTWMKLGLHVPRAMKHAYHLHARK